MIFIEKILPPDLGINFISNNQITLKYETGLVQIENLNNVISFIGKNKNSNADKTTCQKKRDEISQHERKKKSFMIFIEKILPPDLGINFIRNNQITLKYETCLI